MMVCPECAAEYPEPVQYCPTDGSPLYKPDVVDYTGRVLLGQFELREVIDRGAMGTVYRAWQLGMERLVAVKVLNPGLVNDPDLLRRFRREARAAARLSHPNIVTVFVIGELDDGVPFIAMEYVDGTSLAREIAGKALARSRAIHIVRQVSSALEEAHSAAVVHRDLKPDNILLVSTRRSADLVRVLDFGIAKLLADQSVRLSGAALTQAGAVWGTPAYLSPEQATGGEVDQRADLYSVGVILYRLTTGRLPFAGRGLELLSAHAQRPVPDPRVVMPTMDLALAAVIIRCLQKAPADRFQSAEELTDALDALEPARGSVGADVAVVGERGLSVAATVASNVDQAPAADPSMAYAATEHVPAPGEEQDSFLRTARQAVERSTSRRPPRWVGIAFAGLLCVGSAAWWAGMWRQSASTAAVAPDAGAVVLGDLIDARGESSRQDAGAVPPVEELSAIPDGVVPIMVSEGGYALRVLLPAVILVDRDYTIVFEAWDAAGAPIRAPEIVVTVEEPGGVERGLAAKPTARRGQYSFRRRFRSAGAHYVHVFAPAGSTNLKILLDVQGG